MFQKRTQPFCLSPPTEKELATQELGSRSLRQEKNDGAGEIWWEWGDHKVRKWIPMKFGPAFHLGHLYN